MFQHSKLLSLILAGFAFYFAMPLDSQNYPIIDYTDVILNQKFVPNHIFDVVEQMPVFPGGNDSLLSFVSKNLKWPNTDADVQGKVIVRFVVNTNGSISDIMVIRSLELHFDNEAIRVIKKLPKFIPGKQNGKAVNCWYILPIAFKLE